MEFLNPYFLLFISVVPVLFLIKDKKLPFSKETAQKLTVKGFIPKKIKFYLLLTSFILFVISLARPVLNNGYITIKAPVQNTVIALDISREMDKTDLYPNRYKFAVTKINSLLKLLGSQNTALILFDKNTYLISPPTQDHKSLIYLLNHTDIKNIERSESCNIKNLLNSAEKLVKNPKIVIFTSKIYIPENKNVYVYLCRNNAISTNNVFAAGYNDRNIKKIAALLNSSKRKDIKTKNKKELFYFPLALGLALFLFVIFFPVRRRK